MNIPLQPFKTLYPLLIQQIYFPIWATKLRLHVSLSYFRHLISGVSEERVNICCIALIKTFSTFLALSPYGPALVSPQVAGTEAISLLQPPPMVAHHPLSLTLGHSHGNWLG